LGQLCLPCLVPVTAPVPLHLLLPSSHAADGRGHRRRRRALGQGCQGPGGSSAARFHRPRWRAAERPLVTALRLGAANGGRRGLLWSVWTVVAFAFALTRRSRNQTGCGQRLAGLRREAASS